MALTLAFSFRFAPPQPGEEQISWKQLIADHQTSLKEALSLRILRCPQGWSGSLDALVQEGRATALCHDPFADDSNHPSNRERLICDAVIPRYDADRLWLQVHLLDFGDGDPTTDAPLRCQSLDAVPLQGLSNETCWFYPTEDGHYLASERSSTVRFGLGGLADGMSITQDWSYDRGDLCVLWSLMADDDDLSCVGLTYQRRRIDFPRQVDHPATSAIWSSFLVDGMAEPSFQRLSTIST